MRGGNDEARGGDCAEDEGTPMTVAPRETTPEEWDKMREHLFELMREWRAAIDRAQFQVDHSPYETDYSSKD